MLDPKLLRNDLQAVSNRLKLRGYMLDMQRIVELEDERKTIEVATQDLQNERNTKSKAIGQAKAKGEDIAPLLAEVGDLGERLKKSEDALHQVKQRLDRIYLSIPNIPHESVPAGNSEEDNVVDSTVGELPQFDFEPKDHVELGERLGLMDFEAAAKIAGSRFVVLHRSLAQLHRALIQFMLDVHTREHGYQEVYVPYLVNHKSLYGTGQLPKFWEDQFNIAGEWEYSLIPTAEVPVTNLFRDTITEFEDLPVRYVAHTPCFRSEAGSYGKDTRGMIRQHQFEKVELVQVVQPSRSEAALEELRGHAETILQKLGLAYQVVTLCGGDLGFSAAKTYDLEVWLPSQQRYREISSCSNFQDFQARRMKARYRDMNDKKPHYVHTINGSGLAVGRTLLAILENYQDEKGRIHIPEVLQPYMGGQEIIG